MSEFAPVTTLDDLATLDDAEIMAGYRSGFVDQDGEPGNNHSRAFWHGWRNGVRDRGLIEGDFAMMQLASAFVRRRTLS